MRVLRDSGVPDATGGTGWAAPDASVLRLSHKNMTEALTRPHLDRSLRAGGAPGLAGSTDVEATDCGGLFRAPFSARAIVGATHPSGEGRLARTCEPGEKLDGPGPRVTPASCWSSTRRMLANPFPTRYDLPHAPARRLPVRIIPSENGRADINETGHNFHSSND